MMSYGGEYLAFPDAGVLTSIEAALNWEDYFALPGFNGPLSGPNPWAAFPLPRMPRPGSLIWPWGASRFALAHVLMTDAMLARIRPLVYGAKGTQWNALPFIMDDGRPGRSITTNLYMLPARPLDQIPGANGLSSVLLADERFRWWERPGTISVAQGSTTWAQLIGSIASALGVTITADTIAAAYLKPSAGLSGTDISLPPLLDRVLACIGHRLVRKLDGTVITQAPRTAKKSQDAQFAAFTKQKGGQLAFDPKG